VINPHYNTWHINNCCSTTRNRVHWLKEPHSAGSMLVVCPLDATQTLVRRSSPRREEDHQHTDTRTQRESTLVYCCCCNGSPEEDEGWITDTATCFSSDVFADRSEGGETGHAAASCDHSIHIR
jgi:hypothetical protein